MTTTQTPFTSIPALERGERFPTYVGDVITKPAAEFQVGDRWLAIYSPENATVRRITEVWNNGIVKCGDEQFFVGRATMYAVLAEGAGA